MNKIYASFVAIMTLLIFCVGCSTDPQKEQNGINKWKNDNGKIKVLSTTGMIDDLVRQVGGEHVDTLVLIRGDLDPHSYQLVKGDDEKLANAQVIFSNGLGLEHGSNLHYYLDHSPKTVSIGDKIQEQYADRILQYNGQLDPHIWMDVSLWAKTVPSIVEALSVRDPAHAEDYKANGDKLVHELEAVHDEIKKVLQDVPQEKRYLVTSHDAFNYFTKAYLAEEQEIVNDSWQKRFAAPEGLAPESQLSVTHIQQIIDYLDQHDIHVLFPESNVSKDSIRKIVNAGSEKGLNLKIAAEPLYADAMGSSGTEGDTYLKMVNHNAKIIAKYLSEQKQRGTVR